VQRFTDNRSRFRASRTGLPPVQENFAARAVSLDGFDRDGTIAYIAREYDPAAMEAVIERLLAHSP
jgi:hypothetical protein